MKLYIAEKPSLGRAIADALPKPHKKHQGYIEVGNGDVVTWCIGPVSYTHLTLPTSDLV